MHIDRLRDMGLFMTNFLVFIFLYWIYCIHRIISFHKKFQGDGQLYYFMRSASQIGLGYVSSFLILLQQEKQLLVN